MANKVFRANPAYELLRMDELSADEQDVLDQYRGDPDFYAVLRPRASSSLRTKSVCPNTASLFQSLANPGAPPRLLNVATSDLERAVTLLVLDGVLEVQLDNLFVSGVTAHSILCDDSESSPEALGVLGQLSVDALRYAEALDIADSRQLSARLYFYNGIPASAHWRRRLSTHEAITRHWGLDRAVGTTLNRTWMRFDDGSDGGWWIWQAPGFRGTDGFDTRTKCRHKLYVSPVPELAAEALAATVKALSDVAGAAFKIGGRLHGLLRPDKIVCYFANFDELAGAAQQISTITDGMPAHGVPFTAELAGDGLLSWGIDPPPPAGKTSVEGRESWRLWVTNRLATAMAVAKANDEQAVPAWRFALDRLRYDGVDTTTWTLIEGIRAADVFQGVC